ncbi:MAG: hypothetical protein PHU93_01150 [Candidatus Gracilibacteria bacterium]|nr:hypothetical protein [Candidatus Gracilibacteria bacterium]
MIEDFYALSPESTKKQSPPKTETHETFTLTRAGSLVSWGAYLEVNVITQTRILDNAVSRAFVSVEAVINPFTFQVIQQNLGVLKDREISEMIEYANDREKWGYVVQVGPEIQYFGDDRVYTQAEVQKDFAIKKIIKIHDFVLDLIGGRRGIYKGSENETINL